MSRDKLNDRKDRGGGGRYAVEFRSCALHGQQTRIFIPIACILPRPLIYPVSHIPYPREKISLCPCQARESRSSSPIPGMI